MKQILRRMLVEGPPNFPRRKVDFARFANAPLFSLVFPQQSIKRKWTFSPSSAITGAGETQYRFPWLDPCRDRMHRDAAHPKTAPVVRRQNDLPMARGNLPLARPH